MVGVMARRPLSHRILTCHNRESEFSGDHAINISDTIFSFLDEEGSSTESVIDDVYVEDENENENENEERENIEDNQFWKTQHQLLQSVLCRTTTLESQIRGITKQTLKEASKNCSCKMVKNISITTSCPNCLMKEVCTSLQNAGFNSAICRSKWKSSPDIPSGEHTFIDVIDNSSPKKGEVRIIIELNFRGEFELAKASEEYNRLVKCLPEVFVGKIERLLSVIKILCNAAKKCMKDKKMHIAPWRKQKYMQAKWLKTSERMSTTSKSPLSAEEYCYSNRLSRPKASMLTVDLLGNIPSLCRNAVEVV
ncbi:uncharacterized protein LOC107009436 [Solanum pennellii]|uniref:Uncharacterized protein LOC107009436 n=1 Tax=Solanum pennellii TaxID=28526 RepID=A0ABM1G0M7_SOLPN|nr:uncharacterized protein LOC107009436 [Solanum pennellii]